LNFSTKSAEKTYPRKLFTKNQLGDHVVGWQNNCCCSISKISPQVENKKTVWTKHEKL